MSVLFKLTVTNPAELQATWEQVGDTPATLYAAIARIFSGEIDGIEVDVPVTFGEEAPAGSDASNLWVKTSSPPGIGIPYGSGTYEMIYPYPPNTPVIWTKGVANLPDYLRQLSPEELVNFGLTAPAQTSYAYVILEV